VLRSWARAFRFQFLRACYVMSLEFPRSKADLTTAGLLMIDSEKRIDRPRTGSRSHIWRSGTPRAPAMCVDANDAARQPRPPASAHSNDSAARNRPIAAVKTGINI